MKYITLQVHPLSRKVMLAEYGSEPIQIGQRDILFSMLTHCQLRDRLELSKVSEELSATITLAVHDALARHLQSNWYMVGEHLYRWHKDQMCRYVQCRVQAKHEAKASIIQWFAMHHVEEDEYSLEAALKTWQRYREKIRAKNPVFFGRMLGSPSEYLPKKNGRQTTCPDNVVQAAAAHFFQLAHACLRRTPKSLERHALIYMYKERQRLSDRQIAQKLGIPASTVSYAARSMRNWGDTDPVMQHMLRQAVGFQPNQ